MEAGSDAAPLAGLDGITSTKHSASAPMTRDLHGFYFGFHVKGKEKRHSLLLAVVFQTGQEICVACKLASCVSIFQFLMTVLNCL